MPGTGKKIIWNASAELTRYKGDITFKVKGESIAAALAFIKPTEGGSMRRGKQASITWEGGNPAQNVKLQLYRGTELVATLNEGSNSSQYTWNVPKKQAKGNYTMSISAGQEIVKSQSFKIKSKTPAIVKILPIVAVGGLLAILLKPDPPSNDLPEAPGPKGN